MLMTLAASPPLMINDQIDGKAADGQLMIEEQTCDGYIVAHASLVSDRVRDPPSLIHCYACWEL
jgi:hypothetical protein